VTVNSHSVGKFVALLAVVSCLSHGAFAEFKVDRSAMSDAYWKIWNDDVQARIDADIEQFRKADATVEVAAPDVKASGGKVAFRGFRGRYRLTWNGADGKEHSKLVELK